MIETHKLINNKYKTDPQSLFSLPYSELCGHKDKIFKLSARTDTQKHFLLTSRDGFMEFTVFQNN